MCVRACLCVCDSEHHRTCERYDVATSLDAARERPNGNNSSGSVTAAATNETEAITSSAVAPVTIQSSFSDAFQSQRKIQVRIPVINKVLQICIFAWFGLVSRSVPLHPTSSSKPTHMHTYAHIHFDCFFLSSELHQFHFLQLQLWLYHRYKYLQYRLRKSRLRIIIGVCGNAWLCPIHCQHDNFPMPILDYVQKRKKLFRFRAKEKICILGSDAPIACLKGTKKSILHM